MVRYRTSARLDLTVAPLDADRALWSHRTDYAACQTLSDRARASAVEVLRYASARDPHGGANMALLTCRAFASREPLERQTWRLHVGPHGVHAICDYPEQRLGFDRLAFSSDPRIAQLPWTREKGPGHAAARKEEGGRKKAEGIEARPSRATIGLR